jgi:EAL and modified HD-GYP domain-containing signal transduction protein
MSDEVFLARQPILNKNGEIFAYEILYRSSMKNQANFTDDLFATAQVLANTLNNFGLKKITGSKLGFINVNHTVVHKDVFSFLDPEKFVFEILETTDLDIYLLEKIKHLKSEGFIFALDDFVFDPEFADYFEPLFEYLRYIKVDLVANNLEDIKKKFKLFEKYKVKWIAEKIDNREDFEECKNLGFDYFQGYFFAKPAIMKNKKLDPSKLAIIEAINLLYKKPETDEIEQCFKKHPELTINLLNFINSAALGLRNKISSIRQAVALIGQRKLLQWLLMMSYTGVGDKKTIPLFYTASERARKMENLVKLTIWNTDNRTADEAFLVGLLSLLDVLFETPIEEIIQQLHLDEEITAAIIEHKGILGILLNLVEKTEKSEIKIDEILPLLEQIDISMQNLTEVNLESYKWSNEIAV